MLLRVEGLGRRLSPLCLKSPTTLLFALVCTAYIRLLVNRIEVKICFGSMNLELLDPFGRQVPDRVDATLPLAPHLHFRNPNHHLLALGNPSSSSSKKSSKGENSEQHARHSNSTNVNIHATSAVGSGLSETGGTIPGVSNKREVPEWRAAYHVAYNRRGTYLAVGYGSGAVAIHSTSSRTLAALYRSSAGGSSSGNTDGGQGGSGGGAGELLIGNGVTSVSWSRRSRTLLTGAAGDASVHVYDTTHPFGPEEAGLAIDDRGLPYPEDNENVNDRNHSKRERLANTASAEYEQRGHIPPMHSKVRTGPTLFADPVYDEQKYIFVKDRLQLDSINVPMGTKVPQHVIASFVLPPDTFDEPDETEDPDSDKNDDGDIDDNHKKEKKRRKRKRKKKKANWRDPRLNKHPCISFSFQSAQPVGGSLQINPRCPTGGLAALRDGSLVLFWFDPKVSWITHVEAKEEKKKATETESEQLKEVEEGGEKEMASPGKTKERTPKYAIVVPLWSQTLKHFITCAAFDPQGERVYAATKDGTLLGFEVKLLFESLAASSPNTKGVPTAKTTTAYGNVAQSPIKGGLPLVAPHFKLRIPGGASAWHLIVSRNGKYLVLNSSDGALRLYSTHACWSNESKGKGAPKQSLSAAEKPTWTFQDVVSKVKFASCDLSGDGEYVVGGANGNDNRYELSIWNTTTGNLMDKLTGPAVQLYSVAWHPTRSSLAVATSDGLVDVWGPKLNWTAFAPDFQALHKNIVYEEETAANGEKEATCTVIEGDATQLPDASSSSAPMEMDPPTNPSNGNQEGGGTSSDIPKANGKATNDTKTVSSDRDKDVLMGEASVSSKSDRKTNAADAANGAAPTVKNESEPRHGAAKVDVLTKDPVPMFASDSEDESDAFAFEARVKNLFYSRITKFPKESKTDD